MNTVIELVDKLRDTCESHARCNVVEVMGRGAGDIALSAGIASGATAAVVPEFPADDDEICRKISMSRRHGKRNFIILVSEGVGSDYAPALCEKIMVNTGVDTKFARLAHVVRGGNPNLRDRVMASEMGVFAVKELLAGNSNIVICMRNGEIVANDINYALRLDNYYKGLVDKQTLLTEFPPEVVEKLCAEAHERRRRLERLYEVGKTISL
jgi:6-phosphofructokinase 1